MPEAMADEAAHFIALKKKIGEYCDDEPSHLFDLARTDEEMKTQVGELASLAAALHGSHENAPSGIIAPVAKTFIREWRDYEERYHEVVSRVWLAGMIAQTRASLGKPITWEEGYRDAGILFAEKSVWKKTDEWAEEQASTLRNFMYGGVNAMLRTIYEETLERDEELELQASDACVAWTILTRDCAFDMRGFLRRSRIAPLLLVPHAINNNVPGERVDLYELWTETRRSFISGDFWACVALSRAVCEKLLRRFYKAKGADLFELIRDGERVFSSRNAARELHNIRILANVILHTDIGEAKAPRDGALFANPPAPENFALGGLRALRTLIEEIP